MEGQGNISYGRPSSSGGGGGNPGTVTGANDGLTSNGTTVKLGQAVAAAGNPGAFTEDRELYLGTYALHIKLANNSQGLNFVPTNNGGYYLFAAEVFNKTPNVRWEMQSTQTDNGNGTFDQTAFTGWNIDSGFNAAMPSFTTRMEYGYTGSPGGLYEYHLQWSDNVIPRVYRLMSFTHQNQGSQAADYCDLEFSVHTFNLRDFYSENYFTVNIAPGNAGYRTAMTLNSPNNGACYQVVCDQSSNQVQIACYNGYTPYNALVFEFWSQIYLETPGGQPAMNINMNNRNYIHELRGTYAETFNVSSPTGYSQVGFGTGVSAGSIGINDANANFYLYCNSGLYQFYNASASAFIFSINADGSFQSSNPGSGLASWKTGQVLAGAVALDTTHYVEVNIGGTVVKLLKAA